MVGPVVGVQWVDPLLKGTVLQELWHTLPKFQVKAFGFVMVTFHCQKSGNIRDLHLSKIQNKCDKNARKTVLNDTISNLQVRMQESLGG